jgi:histidinol-phosphate aminotransferase
VPPVRADLQLASGYHSAQVPAEVRLNTNESPLPPPDGFIDALAAAISRVDLNRYPDREATELRAALAALHGVGPEQIFCANGSNEVLQCLLLAFGGPGRRALLFEPTYALHSHISRLTGTEVVVGGRDADFRIDADEAVELCRSSDPTITFLCSPNNPTGLSEPRELVVRLVSAAGGLVIVDEAYGQFSQWSALDLRRPPAADGTTLPTPDGVTPPTTDDAATLPAEQARSLVVIRTFSKTWSMAAVRLGYAVADPEVVAACEHVVLPYHLSVPTQIAGTLALRYGEEMAARVELVERERARLFTALGSLAVDTWPSDANFILIRPRARPASVVWADLVADSVLVRDCSTWDGLEGCLRVTVGTPDENDRFVDALERSLR